MTADKNIPRWNLDSIYPSLESCEYKKALEEFQNGMNEIDQLGLRSQKQTLRFRAILKKNLKKLPEFYRRYPQLAEYEFVLNEELDAISHQMTDAEENLAADLQRTGGDAWERLHEQLISTLKDEQTGKTFNELRNDAYSADEKLRKSSYEKELELLAQNRVAFAACLNNLKGETCTLNKRRSWQNAIDRSLSAARMSRKTLNALLGAIEDSLPFWRKYLQTKAEILYKSEKKSEKCRGLAFYDLFAPLPLKTTQNENSILNKIWTF